MAVTIKSKKNLLDFIPVKSARFPYTAAPKGLIQIHIPRESVLDKLVRIFKKTPHEFIIDLDRMGTYTWSLIDGERNIYEIGNALKEEFGEEIEPVYVRTGQFMNMLKNNRLISFRQK